MDAKRKLAMLKLREAAAALAECGEGELVFPGWDFQFTDKATQQHQTRIRDAAEAILGTTNCDTGMLADARSVVALVRYIGDMLEE